jgi:NB-ARC domain
VAPRHFTGRTDALDDLLDEVVQETGTVAICAIDGTAGVGKTALALCWAHRVAGQFPDGQLYVNLRGFDPSGAPAEPAEVIRGFLDAFAVPPERIPVSPDSQAALHRSLMAGRRMLVVLDNARDAEHVRAMLPGTSGCLVLVTSRRQLLSLAVAEGARRIELDVLTGQEAAELRDAAGRLDALGAGDPLTDVRAVRQAAHAADRLGRLREHRSPGRPPGG